jgi:hypothetical protein
MRQIATLIATIVWQLIFFLTEESRGQGLNKQIEQKYMIQGEKEIIVDLFDDYFRKSMKMPTPAE